MARNGMDSAQTDIDSKDDILPSVDIAPAEARTLSPSPNPALALALALYLVGSISSVGKSTGLEYRRPWFKSQLEPGIFFQVFFPTYLSVTASSLPLVDASQVHSRAKTFHWNHYHG